MSCRLCVAPGTLTAGPRQVDGDAYHYLFHVRRLRRGSRVTLFDGAGYEAEATVATVAATGAVLAVAPPRLVAKAPGCQLTVMPALIKGERMDWCVQKLTELGVAEIVPVRTARTVVQLTGDRACRRRQRFAAIAQAAARQCGRAEVPNIRDIADLDSALEAVAHIPCKLMPHTAKTQRSWRDAMPDVMPAAVCVLVGPEGGFADNEVDRAVAAGFIPVSLGPYVLRAETAAVAVAAAFALGLTPPRPVTASE